MDLSFQLYSARNYPPLDDVLRKISALGYTQVEGYGTLYADADGLAASLRQHNLTIPTGHFGLDQLKDTASALKIAKTLGIKSIYCPFLPPDQRPAGSDDWVLRLAETLDSLSKTYRAEGYGFGWHNHDFEFKALSDGRLPMEVLLENALDLEWEMDVAWVVRGGSSPQNWIDNFGDRITAIHVKDIAPAGQATNEDGWADVGHGTMGWDELILAIRAGTKAQYFVAEHDNPSDVERFAARSIATAKNWK